MTGSRGWHRIGPHPAIARWAAAARMAAPLAAPGEWRAGGTWDVGLDALPNDAAGQVAGVPFPWEALPLEPVALHAAQVSTLRPGYPRPDGDEAAHRWRLLRDGAHLDGLLAEGPGRRRHIREPHAWILGITLTACDPGASPLVVWEGSHLALRRALAEALAPHPPAHWPDVDVTEAYNNARAGIFRACPRVELPCRPGEAILMHRMMLHGVAPWAEGALAPPEGRRVAYLRPLMASVAAWIGLD
jgi:hypothetical protein